MSNRRRCAQPDIKFRYLRQCRAPSATRGRTAEELALDVLQADLGGTRLEQGRRVDEALNALGLGEGMPRGRPVAEETQ